jgi:hypothetical protein
LNGRTSGVTEEKTSRAEGRLVSAAPDGEGMRRRVESAWRKAKLGEELTEKEFMIVQWERSIGGCRACYARMRRSIR